MFEVTSSSATEASAARQLVHYFGPERRSTGKALGGCLSHMLDEIDYGMLLVSADAHVLYINHAARQELDAEHPLQLMGGTLRAQRSQDVAPLYDALAATQRGLRKLVTLGAGLHRVSVSVVPLPSGMGGRAQDSEASTLLVLGKRLVCERLPLEGFARLMRLTSAETRVLELLCAGVRPTAIASIKGVGVATVRTQIGSIRSKTGAGSIGELVRQVALLPPMVGALRGSVGNSAGSTVGSTAGMGMGLQAV